MGERIHITGLSYGPHGIGRLGGKVIFTRDVVPGEEVEITVREDRGSFAYADLQRVLTPAAARRSAPCVYLPRCGGCAWQHITYAAQLDAKQRNVRDHLERTAKLVDPPLAPIIPSPTEFGYRGRLTVRVDRGEIGFYAAASHDLVSIERCLIADEVLNGAIAAARELARRTRSAIRRIEIAHGTDEPGSVLVAEVEGTFATADDRVLTQWLADQSAAGVRGVVLHGKGWRRVWGDDRLTLRPLPDELLRMRAGGFAQVNPAANEILLRTVLDMARVGGEHRVLDLYAGVGNFSVPLARRAASVVAVEQNKRAAEDAQQNAAAHGLENLKVVAASAQQALRGIIKQETQFDVVILDPPRSGAAEIIDALLQLRAAVLIYVSCNPATLGRDLRRLGAGYRVDLIQPIDLFPQTYHVESAVRLMLT